MADYNALIPPLIVEEEEDDVIPLPQEHISIESELERFRLQWHEELVGREGAASTGGRVENENITSAAAEDNGNATAAAVEPSVEEQAKFLFMQGVNAEQSGRLANAIQYYRRALQLVPDIESKIEEFKPSPRRDRTESESSSLSTYSDVVETEDEDPADLEDLLAHFNKLRLAGKTTIQPEWETREGGHISTLPTELLVHILKWVISADLDIHSLENTVMTCRGLYLCGRDEALWKLVCARIWGRHLGSAGGQYGGSYRAMYLQRPHTRSNGVYISRCNYYRQGEKGLDNLYKPFHFVEYFRYTRFFPDGKVLMLTTPDAPSLVVPRLRHRSAAVQGIMKGYYRLVADTVTCIMKRRRPQEMETSAYKRYRRNKRNNNNEEDSKEIVFHADLTLKHAGKKSRAMLVWQHYNTHTSSSDGGQESISEFNISNSSFSPMIFSKVKSYTAYSDLPLT